jgi:hypothetical protein
LHIIHETASKENDFVAIRDAGVPVTALNAFDGVEIDVLPGRLVRTCLQNSNFIVALVILSTN